MFLNEISSGSRFKVKQIPADIKPELMRLGICEEETLLALIKIPNGPVVISKDLQEIAIGENFCKRIEIDPLI